MAMKLNRALRAEPTGARRGLRRVGAYESARFYTHRLSLLNRLIARTTKDMLAEHFGISQMEWRILVQLEYRSPSKVSEIHERSLVQKPQISSALPRLVQRGFVVREHDPKDARAPWFAITESGLRLYRDVIRLSRKRQRGLESLLSEPEQAGFEQALDRLIEFFVEQGRGADGLFATADQLSAGKSRRGSRVER
jgi:DNA-binding MarR family transcriptional regulator